MIGSIYRFIFQAASLLAALETIRTVIYMLAGFCFTLPLRTVNDFDVYNGRLLFLFLRSTLT